MIALDSNKRDTFSKVGWSMRLADYLTTCDWVGFVKHVVNDVASKQTLEYHENLYNQRAKVKAYTAYGGAPVCITRPCGLSVRSRSNTPTVLLCKQPNIQVSDNGVAGSVNTIQALCVDMGSSMVKAGFAGDD